MHATLPTRAKPFVGAIAAEAQSRGPRLVFADWLEEQGDPRAAFIRAAVDGGDYAAIRPFVTRKKRKKHGGTIRTAGLKGEQWRLFAADCAQRVLPLYELQHPGDKSLKSAIATARSGGFRNAYLAFHATHQPRAPVRSLGRVAHQALDSAHYACLTAAASNRASVTPIHAASAASAAVEAVRLYLSYHSEGEERWQLVRLGEYKLFGQWIGLLADKPQWWRAGT